MKLHAATCAYIAFRRSLGAVFSSDARILKSFASFAGDIPVDGLTAETCRAFCRGAGPPTRFWERKHCALRGFISFLVARGHLQASPLPDPTPKIPRRFAAHIYSRDELQRLLDATDVLDSKRFPLQPIVFRTVLLVLYATGLRPSESLRLRCCDVNLHERILCIRDTKFFKSRLVPFGTDLADILHIYHTARQDLLMPKGLYSAFFASQTGSAISLATLERIFVILRSEAGVVHPPDARWQPRLHDLRHTFAVHRLTAWYREGADVQALLPVLATYLGHVNIAGTQAYLTITPELLGQASKRFEHYAGPASMRGHNHV